VRRERPDWVIIWGAGPGQSVSVREALRNGIALDHVISVIWISETDLNIIGAQQTKGISRVEGVASGRDVPVIKAILAEVAAKGKGAGASEKIGGTYYNIGVAGTALLVEGARLALKSDGEPLTPAKLKKGLESIKDFTAEGLLPPVTITPEDHQGGGRTRVASWDGEKWVAKNDWAAPNQGLVWDLAHKSAEAFAAAGK
jgi:branched-chain amino acid transport system substrate-binding protein